MLKISRGNTNLNEKYIYYNSVTIYTIIKLQGHFNDMYQRIIKHIILIILIGSWIRCKCRVRLRIEITLVKITEKVSKRARSFHIIVYIHPGFASESIKNPKPVLTQKKKKIPKLKTRINQKFKRIIWLIRNLNQ